MNVPLVIFLSALVIGCAVILLSQLRGVGRLRDHHRRRRERHDRYCPDGQPHDWVCIRQRSYYYLRRELSEEIFGEGHWTDLGLYSAPMLREWFCPHCSALYDEIAETEDDLRAEFQRIKAREDEIDKLHRRAKERQ